MSYVKKMYNIFKNNLMKFLTFLFGSFLLIFIIFIFCKNTFNSDWVIDSKRNYTEEIQKLIENNHQRKVFSFGDNELVFLSDNGMEIKDNGDIEIENEGYEKTVIKFSLYRDSSLVDLMYPNPFNKALAGVSFDFDLKDIVKEPEIRKELMIFGDNKPYELERRIYYLNYPDYYNSRLNIPYTIYVLKYGEDYYGVFELFYLNSGSELYVEDIIRWNKLDVVEQNEIRSLINEANIKFQKDVEKFFKHILIKNSNINELDV